MLCSGVNILTLLKLKDCLHHNRVMDNAVIGRNRSLLRNKEQQLRNGKSQIAGVTAALVLGSTLAVWAGTPGGTCTQNHSDIIWPGGQCVDNNCTQDTFVPPLGGYCSGGPATTFCNGTKIIQKDAYVWISTDCYTNGTNSCTPAYENADGTHTIITYKVNVKTGNLTTPCGF